MPEIEIRTALLGDIGTITELNAQLFQYESQFVPTFNFEWTRSSAGQTYFTRRITDETGIMLLAEVDNTPIGYACGWTFVHPARSFAKMAELENIYVSPEMRGKGIGSRLVTAFKALAQQKGASVLKVGALAKNSSALEFYRKQGFYDHDIIFEVGL